MIHRFDNIAIRGIVSAVPKRVESNASYAEILGEKRVRRQIRFTGIESKHINEWDQTTADLCTEASKTLLEKTGWPPETIRVLILVTQSPSLISPASSFLVHKELGLSGDCVVFDVNLGCTGYVTGLRIISSILQNMGENSRGLLLAGDTHRNKFQVQPEKNDDLADLMLFGSAGVATALEVVPKSEEMCFDDKAYGAKYQALYHRFNECTTMDGEAVFEFAINEVVDNVVQFMDVISKEKIDYYVFHQAQKFMLQNIAKNVGINEEKMLYSLKKYGNNSSASVPLTICYNCAEISRQESTRLLLCGFGVGMACSLGWLKLDRDCYLDIIETDKIYPY